MSVVRRRSAVGVLCHPLFVRSLLHGDRPVPLLWTGVRHDPPGRTDKNLCRCFGAPACRVSPDHLITLTGVPRLPPPLVCTRIGRNSSGAACRGRHAWRLWEPPSAMQEGTSPSLSSPDRDLASIYPRTAVPIRDFDPIAAQVRQCLACPPGAPCQLNALQQPPCSHIECRVISRHRPEAPLRGPRSLQTTTQPRQLHPHHRSVRS